MILIDVNCRSFICVGTKLDQLNCQPGTFYRSTKIIPRILVATKQHHQDSKMKDTSCVEQKVYCCLAVVSNGIIDHEVCVVQATRHCKCHKPTYFYKSISAPGVSWYMFHIILSLVSLGLISTYASPHPVPDTYSKLKQLRCQPSARSVAQLVQSKVSDVWKSSMDQTNIRYLYTFVYTP